MTCAEINFIDPGDVSRGFWREPLHQDGGASVIHMGLTLFGRRDLRLLQGGTLPDVVLHLRAGSVYVGQLTGAEHQVLHCAADGHELLHVPPVGAYAVTVMFRTALFPYNRARLRNTTPSPSVVFERLVQHFRHSFSSDVFRLPTLAECLTSASVDGGQPRPSKHGRGES